MRASITSLLLAAGLLGLACDLEPEPELEVAEALVADGADLGQPDENEEGDGLAPMIELDPEDNQACIDCHPQSAATWTGSLHQRAWVEPAFQESYSREPLEFCRGCHAPRAEPGHEPTRARADLGVDCVSCHVREGVVHTGPAADDRVAPHALERSETFGEDACAGCHQFEFPAKAHRAPGMLMQKTMFEHERTPWAALTCADCHFPVNDDGVGRNHGLAISRNPDLLRASLTAAVERIDENHFRFALEPNGVGHRFPTGDLFRRLELRVEARDLAGELLGSELRYLARHFASESDGHGYIGEAPDDRLDGPVSLDLSLDAKVAKRAATIHWSVSYQRVDSRDHAQPERSKLAGEVRLAEGTFEEPPCENGT